MAIPLKVHQHALFDRKGHSAARLTTLSYDYADKDRVPEHFHDTDQLVFNASGLPPKGDVTLSGVRSDGATTPLFTVTATATGDVDQALSYTDFERVYHRAVLTPARRGAARITTAPGDPFCGM